MRLVDNPRHLIAILVTDDSFVGIVIVLVRFNSEHGFVRALLCVALENVLVYMDYLFQLFLLQLCSPVPNISPHKKHDILESLPPSGASAYQENATLG